MQLNRMFQSSRLIIYRPQSFLALALTSSQKFRRAAGSWKFHLRIADMWAEEPRSTPHFHLHLVWLTRQGYLIHPNHQPKFLEAPCKVDNQVFTSSSRLHNFWSILRPLYLSKYSYCKRQRSLQNLSSWRKIGIGIALSSHRNATAKLILFLGNKTRRRRSTSATSTSAQHQQWYTRSCFRWAPSTTST